ncbi:MBL fold metallo-hydrolase [Streptomyces vastus]|uniref:MBL fold metallo-hydrolase n=1 Tax=Streptomyces vastus TaxID=285451 RepID=UPI003CD0BD25
MFFVDTIEVAGLGNRSYLAGGERTAAAVAPPRDVDQVIAAAARRGVLISHVVETHVHNDYVTGGLELARITGASYLVPAGARVSFASIPVHDGDRTEIDSDAGLTLRAVATPGYTPHHTSYVLEDNGTAVAVFTGGSLLIGTVGPPGPGRAAADGAAGPRPARLRAPPGGRAARRHGSAAHARIRQLLLVLPGGGQRHDHRQGEGVQRSPHQGRRHFRRRPAGRPRRHPRLLHTHGPCQCGRTRACRSDAARRRRRRGDCSPAGGGGVGGGPAQPHSVRRGACVRLVQLRGRRSARPLSRLADPVGQAGHAARRVARATRHRPARAGPRGNRPPCCRGHRRTRRLGPGGGGPGFLPARHVR